MLGLVCSSLLKCKESFLHYTSLSVDISDIRIFGQALNFAHHMRNVQLFCFTFFCLSVVCVHMVTYSPILLDHENVITSIIEPRHLRAC